MFIFSALIVFVASVLHGATGFGFSIAAIPLLLIFHEPTVAVQLNLLISIIVSVALMPDILANLDRTLLRRFIVASIAGAPFGLAALLYSHPTIFKLSIAVLTVGVVTLLQWRLRFQRTVVGDYLTGWLAGGFTAAVGMGGIPLLIYFLGNRAPPAMVRATVLAFFLFIYTLALIQQTLVITTTNDIWWLSLSLIAPALAGVWIGQKLHGKISSNVFYGCMYGVLLGSSVFLFGSAYAGV